MGLARGVEAEGVADGFDDSGRRGDAAPLFEAGVVVGGDTGQARDLLSPQPGYAADASVGGQAGSCGVALGTGAFEEVREFAVVQGHDISVADVRQEGPS